jgi:hypothetical protein
MTNENKPTIELGKQYQTRDGREAGSVQIYPLAALELLNDGGDK